MRAKSMMAVLGSGPVLWAAIGVSVQVAAADASPDQFHATFVDIYSVSVCPTSPPTFVFCGSGNVAGVGAATSTAFLTAMPTPISGTDCFLIHAIRTITMTDGSGSLTLTETGTKCPPSASSNSGEGSPFTVDKTYTVSGGTGRLAGAIGTTGTDINRSAGNSQVSVLSGTLSLS